MRSRFVFFLTFCVIQASHLVAGAAPCFVCGDLIDKRVYLIRDRVTDQKEPVCESCGRLNTVCYVCGMPVKANLTELPDGRVLCTRDAKSVILDEAEAKKNCREVKESLDRLFSRFLAFPDTNVSIAIIDRVNLQQLFKFPGNDYECPNALGYLETKTNQHRLEHIMSLLGGLTQASLKSTCAHEYSHAWLNENIPDDRKETLSRDAVEAFCELVAYMLMDSQNEEMEKKAIKLNFYTRGQIHLFLDAEKRHGFNDVVEWLKYGVDSRLDGDDLDRVRRVEMPQRSSASAPSLPVYPAEPPPAPDRLILRGISRSKSRPWAIINDRTFEVTEEGKVRIGNTNVSIRCLAIREDFVLIRIVGTGEEQELRMKSH